MFDMFYLTPDDRDTKKPTSAEIIDKTDRMVSEQLKAGFPTIGKTKPEKKKDQTKPEQQEPTENKEQA